MLKNYFYTFLSTNILNMRFCFILYLFVFIINTTIGQSDYSINEEKIEKIDDLLNQMHENDQFNGTVLLAEGDDIIYEKILGYSNIEKKEKLTVDASFRLASVSKQFIGMAIMILKERGKLDYDDDIQKHLPELPYAGVTIRHLLWHTGGLPDYMNLFEQNWDTEKPDEKRKMAYNADAVALFAKLNPKPDFPPGEKWAYSNTGYVFLGEIVERASGQPVADFIQKNIYDPLEMTHSHVFQTNDKFNPKQRVYGFNYSTNKAGFEVNDWTYINGMIGDGGLYSSARDLLNWSQALDTEKLVKKSTLEEAFTSGKLNNGEETGYGFGWGVNKTESGEKVVSHSGGWVGFRTYISRMLDSKMTFIFLTNHSSQHLRMVMSGVRNILKGESYEVPKMAISKIIAKTIEQKGIEAATEQYWDLKENASDEYDFAENLLNNLGYQYLNQENYDAAVAVFKLNVAAYPESFNVYDSLGEAYLELAKKNYAKSVEINPGNGGGREVLESLGVELEEVKVSEAILETYVGEYELAPTFIVTVTKEGNQLFVQATGQPRFEVFPETENKFYLKVVQAQITFNKNDEGVVESLTMDQAGMSQVAKKR